MLDGEPRTDRKHELLIAFANRSYQAVFFTYFLDFQISCSHLRSNQIFCFSCSFSKIPSSINHLSLVFDDWKNWHKSCSKMSTERGLLENFCFNSGVNIQENVNLKNTQMGARSDKMLLLFLYERAKKH